MSESEELQREITRIALRALEGTRFALAGSGAIREHGIVDRPTEDVDLFTSDTDVARFANAVEVVVGAVRARGYTAVTLRQVEQFARIEVAATDGRQVDIDMGVDWRESESVMLSIGHVLSVQDAVGNKISALYSRAYARDFIDVDAIRRSGRFTDERLILSAIERDPGFEVATFAGQLRLADRVTPEQVAQYEINRAQLAAIQGRLAAWAKELLGGMLP